MRLKKYKAEEKKKKEEKLKGRKQQRENALLSYLSLSLVFAYNDPVVKSTTAIETTVNTTEMMRKLS